MAQRYRGDPYTTPIFAVAVAASFAAVWGISFIVDEPRLWGSWALGDLAVPTAALAWTLGYWRDAFVFCKFWFVAAFVVALVSAFFVLGGSGGVRLVALLVMAVSVGVAVWAWKVAHQAAPTSGPASSLLRQTHGDLAVMDREGVLAVMLVAPAKPESGGELMLRFDLENCWTSPRNVSIDVVPVRERGHLLLEGGGHMEVQLGPLEAGTAAMPLRFSPPGPGPFACCIDIQVGGFWGRRLKIWRGKPVDTRVTPAESIAYLFVGAIVWGGGLRANFGVPARSAELAAILQPTTWERWKPV
jgi:hypothetical protein